MLFYSKRSFVASILLFCVLTAANILAQRKPISTKWVPADNSFKTAVLEDMKARLNGLNWLHIDEPEDSAMFERATASFREVMADSNVRWEREILKLQYGLQAAVAQSALGKTRLSQLQMELRVVTSQKSNIEDEIRATRIFIAELDSGFRSSKEQYQAVYTNYQRYYVVVVKAQVPWREAVALRPDSLITKLEPVVFEIAQKRGLQAFLESRSLLEDQDYGRYIAREGIHCVAGLLTPPRIMIRNSGESDKWTYFVVYGLYVQPKIERPGPGAKERKIPAGWEVSVQISHDVLQARFSESHPGSLPTSAREYEPSSLMERVESFIFSGGVEEEFSFPPDSKFHSCLTDVVEGVYSFIDPGNSQIEEWKAQCGIYGRQLLRTLERKSVLETNLMKLNLRRATYEREIEELENQIRIQENIDQQNGMRESQAKARWMSHILNRKIIYFEDSEWAYWEDGTAREASSRQVENLLSQYINNAQKRYLDSVTAYVREGAKVTFERQNAFGLEPSGITRYKILYHCLDRAKKRSKVGLAVEFNMKLDERYFLGLSFRDPRLARARARIDSKRGFVVYDGLVYAKAANVFETWAQANAAADKANSEGLYGYRNWRLPTKEELEKIRDLSKEKGPMTFFPELAIEPGRSYWTQTAAKGLRHSQSYCVIYFNRTAVKNQAHPEDGASYILVAEASGADRVSYRFDMRDYSKHPSASVAQTFVPSRSPDASPLQPGQVELELTDLPERVDLDQIVVDGSSDGQIWEEEAVYDIGFDAQRRTIRIRLRPSASRLRIVFLDGSHSDIAVRLEKGRNRYPISMGSPSR